MFIGARTPSTISLGSGTTSSRVRVPYRRQQLLLLVHKLQCECCPLLEPVRHLRVGRHITTTQRTATQTSSLQSSLHTTDTTHQSVTPATATHTCSTAEPMPVTEQHTFLSRVAVYAGACQCCTGVLLHCAALWSHLVVVVEWLHAAPEQCHLPVQECVLLLYHLGKHAAHNTHRYLVNHTRQHLTATKDRYAYA